MSVQAFRIVKARLAAGAFSGEGARLYGGRWNSPGTRVVYVAATRSLAMLEILVHTQSRQLLSNYVVIPVNFSDSLVTDVDLKTLPRDWQSFPAPPQVQQTADQWVAADLSAVLRVPSAVVNGEFNYLLNPAHPDFTAIKIGKPQPIEFDPRLK